MRHSPYRRFPDSDLYPKKLWPHIERLGPARVNRICEAALGYPALFITLPREIDKVLAQLETTEP